MSIYINRLESHKELGPLLGNIPVQKDGVTIDRNIKRAVGCPSREFLYLEVPKVACTSIKEAIGVACDIPNELIFEWQRGHIPWGDMAYAQERKIFMFSFVRNPFDRLVSAYESKINQDPAIEDSRKLVMTARNAIGVDHVSFEQFVELIVTMPDDYANIHWRSQHKFLCDANMNLFPSFLGRFETLYDDMQKVFDIIGIPLHLKKRGSSKRESDYRHYYTPSLRQSVAKHYEVDLAMFNYQF